MELRDAILTRRSYTNYLDKKVDLQLIGEILNLAIYAPSAGNMQNWNIVIVDDDDKRKQIAQACLKQMWMYQAPVHIVILNKKPDIQRMFGKKGETYGIQNCAALAQNILLLATDAGLASCWVGSFDKDAINGIVGAPSTQEPEIIITLGYSKDKPVSTRYKLERVCCFNQCGITRKDFGFFPLEKHKIKMEEMLKKESKSLVEKIKSLFKKDSE